jgi:hypothetical protein
MMDEHEQNGNGIRQKCLGYWRDRWIAWNSIARDVLPLELRGSLTKPDWLK